MPVLFLWAFMAYSRVKFTFIFASYKEHKNGCDRVVEKFDHFNVPQLIPGATVELI
jgi:hypothetical protein